MAGTNGTASSSNGMRRLPMIVGTRSVFGIVPCTSRRNVSWSTDGQCLLVTRQGVTVATPYLTTTLPKPELLLDTSMQGGPANDDDDDDELDVDADLVGRKLARPARGELGWWMTAVGFDKGKAREDEYGWNDVGDELTGLVIDRDKERAVRSATWSPSGLSDLGTPFLAVISSTAQVSVFSPGDDLYTKQFVEFVDLTKVAIDLLPEQDRSPRLSVGGMLRVRAVAMEWSRSLPLLDMVGIDGSLLAIANRAGNIDFWTCGPDRQFARVADVCLQKPWAADVTWTQWKVVNETDCTAQLAISTTDGAVWVLPVTRRAAVEEGTWSVELGQLEQLVPGDGRVITILQWVSDDFLVWAKSGSVHFKQASWATPKAVRLQRVGNWAGCNALGACVGLHLTRTTLTVVLSTLTHHIINNATTEPELAPTVDSLRSTLAARDVFLDCARRRRRGFYAANDREYTSHTAGWAAVDTSGDIVSWMAEPITFHNLDSATEVNRISDFVVADLKTGPERSSDVIAALVAAINNPPNLMHHSPLGIVMPHLLRILVSEENMGQALLDAVAHVPPPPQPWKWNPTAAIADARTLTQALWGSSAPDALRLHLVLAHWGQRTFPNLTVEFANAVVATEQALQKVLATSALLWASASASGEDEDSTPGPLDAQYLGHLFELCTRLGAPPPPRAERLRALAAENGGVACPACGSAVTSGGGSSAFCEKGHEWERCSVTHLLITIPEYRLCSVCPAVSLLPSSLASMGGTDRDTLVRVALDAAVQCLTCGGRWARAV